MPILNKEPSLHPEWLLEPEYEATVGDGGDQDSPRRWWAVYTRPRQEKVLARIFWENGSHFYLPLVPRKGVYQRRTVVSHLPLFEGYVFLFGSEEQRVAALATNRVYHIVGVNEPLQFVRDLRQIRRLIASNAPLTVESRLTSGDRVRVKKGPLAQLEGTVLVRRGKTRLLVQVNFLQQGASVEIDDYLLEPI